MFENVASTTDEAQYVRLGQMPPNGVGQNSSTNRAGWNENTVLCAASTPALRTDRRIISHVGSTWTAASASEAAPDKATATRGFPRRGAANALPSPRKSTITAVISAPCG